MALMMMLQTRDHVPAGVHGPQAGGGQPRPETRGHRHVQLPLVLLVPRAERQPLEVTRGRW